MPEAWTYINLDVPCNQFVQVNCTAGLKSLTNVTNTQIFVKLELKELTLTFDRDTIDLSFPFRGKLEATALDFPGTLRLMFCSEQALRAELVPATQATVYRGQAKQIDLPEVGERTLDLS